MDSLRSMTRTLVWADTLLGFPSFPDCDRCRKNEFLTLELTEEPLVLGFVADDLQMKNIRNQSFFKS